MTILHVAGRLVLMVLAVSLDKNIDLHQDQCSIGLITGAISSCAIGALKPF